MAESRCSQCNDLDPRDHPESRISPKASATFGKTDAVTCLSVRRKVDHVVASSTRCSFCRLLKDMVLSFAPQLREQDDGAEMYLDLEEHGVAHVEVILDTTSTSAGSSDEPETVAQFFVYNQGPNPVLPMLGCLPGTWSRRPDSDACLEFIERKMQECISSHSPCRTRAVEQGGDHPSLPTRILHVGSREGDDIRLVRPGRDGSSSRGRYAALSHCWGSFQPIRTLSSNEADMARCVPWENLSAVFRDAVRLCRRLRITYLWIDSLCIVQDNLSDWERESARMCDYYEQAYITISATSSPNGTVPFYATEHSAEYGPRRFEIYGDKANAELARPLAVAAGVYARSHTGDSVGRSRAGDGGIDDDGDGDGNRPVVSGVGPLSRRAWVWQETVLSTRVLHFTRSELVWDCRAQCVAEDGAVPRALDSMRLGGWLPRLRAQPHATWAMLLQSYTPRDLTYATDRLPALSGVAARMSEAVPVARYCAGLWEDDLLRGLCWSVDYVSSQAERTERPPEQYIAPSWSWASVGGAISPYLEDPDRSFVALAAVVSCVCDVPGSNPWGRVDGGRLILTGMVADIMVTCSDPYSCWAYTIGVDPDETEPLAADCTLTASLASESSTGHVGRATVQDLPMPFRCKLPCLLLGRDAGESEADGEEQIFVMVLGTQRHDGDYSRIGLAVVANMDWFKNATERVLGVV